MGHLPIEFNPRIIKQWKSDLFEIADKIESFGFQAKSQREDWSFSDEQLETEIPKITDGANFTIALVNIPLEDKYFARLLSDNRIVLTFHEIKDYLESKNIPIENIVLRVLYSSLFVYKRYREKIPPNSEVANFTHDDTRGCLYDMDGIRGDLIYSCDQPILCDGCRGNLINHHISKEDIDICKREIIKIKKPLVYKISDFIKKRPLVSISISAVAAIFIGVVSAILSYPVLNALGWK